MSRKHAKRAAHAHRQRRERRAVQRHRENSDRLASLGLHSHHIPMMGRWTVCLEPRP